MLLVNLRGIQKFLCFFSIERLLKEEKFENTKWVIRNCKQKTDDKTMVKSKRTKRQNNDPQNTENLRLNLIFSCATYLLFCSLSECVHKN